MIRSTRRFGRPIAVVALLGATACTDGPAGEVAMPTSDALMYVMTGPETLNPYWFRRRMP